ncbi:DUF4249 family protein [Chitinophagaceae bacterium MMS25-I14]
MSNQQYKNSSVRNLPGAAVCILLLCLLLLSCEKEVHINLNSGATQLVVEGAIEKDLPPYVILTKSIGYLSKIDLSTQQNSYVHDATVTVSDGSQSIKLREYLLDSVVGGTHYKFYFYSIDTADITALLFRGKTEHFYKLSIVSEGKTYEATTKIPNCKPLDSLWYAKPEDSTVARKMPGARDMWFRYIDPDTPGNCGRYFTNTNNGPYYAPINSVFNDEIINGSSVSFRLAAGFDHSKNPDFDSLGRVYLGDTITVKWCAIDKAVYDFFNTFEYSASTVGSPFVSPVNVKTNISGGALGIWAGYGSTFRTIIISD